MSAFMSAFASLVGSSPICSSRSSRPRPPPPRSSCSPRSSGSPSTRSPGAAARGQKARSRLQPQIAELRKKHGRNPERMQKAIVELHAAEKVSPLSGCLPSLLQMPAFFLLYHLFSSGSIGGEPNALLSHDLLGAPLGGRWHDALEHGGPFGGQGLVYLGLFVIVAAVATFSYGRTKRQMAAHPMTPAAGPGRTARARDGRDDQAHSAAVLLHPDHRGRRPAGRRPVRRHHDHLTAVERAWLYRDMPVAGAAMATAAYSARPMRRSSV